MKGRRQGLTAAEKLRAEFGGRALNRAVTGVVLRAAGFVTLCAIGSRFLMG